MENVIVSIGRNISGAPMPDTKWTRFQSEVAKLIDTSAGNLYYTGLGIGYYAGKQESSRTWIASEPRTPHARGRLERRLARLVKDFGQDSIAVTYGAPKLVTATRD